VFGAHNLELFFRQQSEHDGPYQHIRVWNGIYDGHATRQAIRDRFSELSETIKEDDVVLLFISGHGFVPAGQEMFYFAPYDLKGPDPEEQRRTALSTAMIAEAIRNIPARRVVLIIDACQSGGAIESLAKIAEIKAMGPSDLVDQPIEARKQRIGIYVITATTPLQEAVQSSESRNDPVVSALLGAFESVNDDGEARIRDVVRYLQAQIPLLSAHAGERHTPMVIQMGVDFPLASNKSSEVSGHK
jgi:uncharacterized caspase-like protein